MSSSKQVYKLTRHVGHAPNKERFADSETGTGITLARDAVRDSCTSFALLTTRGMTAKNPVIQGISVTRDQVVVNSIQPG
ncbi:MAG TPA: hypothetical protein VJ728_08160 [Candidatus Binataceae bacterium]|nr:hypothetical protein [Candidatus Binataceae bacterium]